MENPFRYIKYAIKTDYIANQIFEYALRLNY